MIDFETMSTKTSAAVIQIGACYFDRTTGETLNMFGPLNVSLETEMDHGFDVDANTILWWMKQSDEARKSLIFNIARSHNAFCELNNFLNGCDEIWSHATFDHPIMMHHFDVLGIKPSFQYWLARDVRTILELAEMSDKATIKRLKKEFFQGENVAHNALFDCKFQAHIVGQAWKEITNEYPTSEA